MNWGIKFVGICGVLSTWPQSEGGNWRSESGQHWRNGILLWQGSTGKMEETESEERDKSERAGDE